MSFSLEPQTTAGSKTIAAARSLVAGFAARAAEADATNAICKQNYDELIDSGVACAFVPTELGGFGLRSIEDWITTIATLARGDGSSAIAINMQLGISRGMAQAYEATKARNKDTSALATPLKQLVTGDMRICATATEPGTDNLHPLTEAVANDQGFVINGRKIFVTMSPLATHLGMNLRMRDADGDHLVSTMLPMNTPGLEPQDDWNALGMRASGSQSVVFNNVQVPAGAIRKLGPWGTWSVGVLMNRALGNLPLVGAFMGIAEAAHDLALEKIQGQKRVATAVTHRSGVQHHVGESEILLAQCRSILSAAGKAADDFLERHATTPPSMADCHQLMQDYQAAKWVVNRGAIDIVSRAMDLLGGAGYTNAHPLARMYRDVRAGPFMQPFAPTEAREYIGKVALGLWPED